ncbi:hypothetical protein NIES2107_60990 [Nostoc carneum NIES-2107]|nr:hypothetical protein NIES2107_60990 [Nostoc carneum NIES-2107]
MSEESLPQPDPSWDYYTYWNDLERIKDTINTALKLMAQHEESNTEANKDIKQLLNKASEKLIEVITQIESA